MIVLMNQIITIALVGLSVGLDNFAASIAIGLGKTNKLSKLQSALIFGLFETAMTVLGLYLGKDVSSYLGTNANLIGGGLLCATGLYLTIGAVLHVDDKGAEFASKSRYKLILTAISLSIDNLIVGFSLGTRIVSLWLSIIILAIMSVSLSLLGLEVGSRVGKRFEEYSEIISGVILILLGLAIIFKIL